MVSNQPSNPFPQATPPQSILHILTKLNQRISAYYIFQMLLPTEISATDSQTLQLFGMLLASIHKQP